MAQPSPGQGWGNTFSLALWPSPALCPVVAPHLVSGCLAQVRSTPTFLCIVLTQTRSPYHGALGESGASVLWFTITLDQLIIWPEARAVLIHGFKLLIFNKKACFSLGISRFWQQSNHGLSIKVQPFHNYLFCPVSVWLTLPRTLDKGSKSQTHRKCKFAD